MVKNIRFLFFLILMPEIFGMSALVQTHLLFAQEIGVNYHAVGPNFNDNTTKPGTSDVFLPKYHIGNIKQTVINDLNNMKAAGVDFISTRIYIGADPSVAYENRSLNRYFIAFPPRPEELTNIENYVDDVNSAGLTLDLGFFWLGKADYTIGCVDPADDGSGGFTQAGLGPDHESLTSFKNKVTSHTIAKVLQKISPGEVRNFYLDGEVLYHPDPDILPDGSLKMKRRNENWFFENAYGYFAHILTRDNKGNPMVYFLPTAPSNPNLVGGILNEGWHKQDDPNYPQTENHRTMYWPFRSMLFIQNVFQAKSWPAAWKFDRFDFSFYVDTPHSSEYDDHIERVLDDADAVIKGNFGSFFGIDSYAFAEASYLTLGKLNVLCNELAAQSYRLEAAAFWTTPYSATRKGYDHLEVGAPTVLGNCQ